MEYSTLVTARRKEEIYPPHIHWLAYDSNNNLVGYLGNNGETVQLEDDEEVTPEKIVASLSDLIKERDELRSKVSSSSNSITNAQTKFKLEFSIRGDDLEEIYGINSRKDAEEIIKRNQDKFGVKSITDINIKKYKISFE